MAVSWDNWQVPTLAAEMVSQTVELLAELWVVRLVVSLVEMMDPYRVGMLVA